MNSFVFLLYKIAGVIVTPPGCFFVALLLLSRSGMRGAGDRAARRGSVRLLALTALLYALFMPITAEFLMGRLEVDRPALPDDDRPTLVAVLAGGGTHPAPRAASGPGLELSEQSYQRLAEGVSAANQRGWPLIYSGAYSEGDAAAHEASLRAQAAQWGFRGELIVEAASRTTWENLREIAKAAERGGYVRVVLSTTAFHMRRALWMAERQIPDAEIVPWPSGWRSTRDRLTLYSFSPVAKAFYDSCLALRELVGLTAYRIFR